MEKNAKLKEKQKWSNESSILIPHENCEVSVSSTLRTRKLRRPLRMLVRNWNTNCSCYALRNNEEELWE